MQKFREANIQTDVNKCEFHVIETKFLKIIIDRDDIKMNFEKVKTIVKWNTSNHIKKTQVFLKFVTFYRRFVKDFFQDRQIIDTINKKRSIFLLIKKLLNSIRTIKKENHRDIRIIISFIQTRNVFEIWFVWLRISESFISKREWWFNQISNVFLENFVFSWMQLWNIW